MLVQKSSSRRKRKFGENIKNMVFFTERSRIPILCVPCKTRVFISFDARRNKLLFHCSYSILHENDLRSIKNFITFYLSFYNYSLWQEISKNSKI